MNRGDRLFYPDWTFDDGGHTNKILILLTDHIKDDILVTFITSQFKNGRIKDLGCQHRRGEFFFRAGEEFEKDTWIQLRRVRKMSVSIIQKFIDAGACRVLTPLSMQRMNEIKNCLLKSGYVDFLAREDRLLLDVK